MKTPPDILDKFEEASQGLDYGSVSLILTVKHGSPRYVIAREESFLPKDGAPTGESDESKEKV
jgi:hypothetical protein